jgi:multicomponent Na+:H+ antiporter subunit E
VSAPEAAVRTARQVPVLATLVVVWMLLWGSWSWANLLSGTAVALLVTRLLPLPPVTEHLRVRPVAALVFTGHFLAELAVSSTQVAWHALRPGPVHPSALISVQLRTDSDLLLTLISEALTLVPGSIVLDLDREHSVIAVHLFPVRDRDQLEQRRAGVLAMEDRIVRAFGGRADIAALEREPDRPEEDDGADGRGARSGGEAR